MSTGPVRGLLVRCCATPAAAALTVLLAAAAVLPIALFGRWALIDAVWSGDATACRIAAGACWAFIGEKWRLIVFGLYPPAEQWRAALAGLLIIGLPAIVRYHRRGTGGLWPGGLALMLVSGLAVWLLAGGGGLEPVPARLWGGLPLTLWLTLSTLTGAFPLALLLALARRSTLAVPRVLATLYIETLRAVPLVSVLFMAAVMLPLLLPAGLDTGKLWRAQLALVLFVAAYLAEALRGGLAVVAAGQYEAAAALGLGRWQTLRTVVLPQGLRAALPALTGIAIGTFKDTSLVLVIGLFDLMTTTRAALGDPRWLGFSIEGYVFAGAIYGVLAWGLSCAGRSLEGSRQASGL